MKLATLKNNSQDGELWVVSRDLYRCAPATDIAPTMQAALDNWRYCFAKLQQRYEDLNSELIYGDAFLQENCAPPLPRGTQWGGALHQASRLDMMASVQGKPSSEPVQAPLSQLFSAPYDPINLMDPRGAVDFEPEIAVVTGDVPLGAEPDQAGNFIRLLMLSNEVLVRSTALDPQGAGSQLTSDRLPSTFSPVAVTVDELEHFWDDYRIHLPLFSFINGEVSDHPPMDEDVTANFAALISHAALHNPLRAGTILGSRARLRANQEQSQNQVELSLESSSKEDIRVTSLRSELLSYGDELRIEMFNPEGLSIFGAIYQVVKHSTS